MPSKQYTYIHHQHLEVEVVVIDCGVAARLVSLVGGEARQDAAEWVLVLASRRAVAAARCVAVAADAQPVIAVVVFG